MDCFLSVPFTCRSKKKKGPRIITLIILIVRKMLISKESCVAKWLTRVQPSRKERRSLSLSHTYVRPGEREMNGTHTLWTGTRVPSRARNASYSSATKREFRPQVGPPSSGSADASLVIVSNSQTVLKRVWSLRSRRSVADDAPELAKIAESPTIYYASIAATHTAVSRDVIFLGIRWGKFYC